MRAVRLGLAVLFGVSRWVEALWCRLVRRPLPSTFVVLMYHSVKAAERERFARQIDFLARRTCPVPADFVDAAGSAPGRRHHVAVTFDDGYRSVLENAVPILLERGIPTTLFVPTSHLGGRPVWITDDTSRDRDETLLSAEELRSLRKAGLAVGAHGATHRPLAALSPAEALTELSESRKALGSLLGEEIRMCALPYGSSSPDVLRLASQAGYERVFLGDPLGSRRNVDGHVAGRIGVSPGDWPLEYRLKVHGAYQWLPLAIAAKRRVAKLLQGLRPALARARQRPTSSRSTASEANVTVDTRVALLTAGKDRHYVIGLLRALQRRPVHVDCIAGDEVAAIDAVDISRVGLYNFVGNQEGGRSFARRVADLLAYYARLVAYGARTEARIFHIQWFRTFPRLEGILLPTYLKLLGKKLVFTAHNVEAEARDGSSTLATRLSLRLLYHVVDHVLVHTAPMRDELTVRFGIPEAKVTVVPFGINDVIPCSPLTRREAKQRLGFRDDDRVLLFFGTIVPYKGVEDLLGALAALVREDGRFRLIIAGPVWRQGGEYWQQLESKIDALGLSSHVRKDVRFTYLPDEEVSLFFRAADVSVLPYKRIYQSGVLALSYYQGLPVIAADVGSFGADVLEGKTGLLFRPGDVRDLAEKIRLLFESDLYRDLELRRSAIREHGEERFSWERNADLTFAVYQDLLRRREGRR